jgi:hypothetical protein
VTDSARAGRRLDEWPYLFIGDIVCFFCLLFFICYFFICYFLFALFYLLFFIRSFLFAIFYSLFFICYFFFFFFAILYCVKVFYFQIASKFFWRDQQFICGKAIVTSICWCRIRNE